MELNQTTTEQTNVVVVVETTEPQIVSTKKTKKSATPIPTFLPKDLSPIREMNEKELRDTFLQVKKILSEIGNQSCDIADKHLFDTCVVILKTMSLYTEHSKK